MQNQCTIPECPKPVWYKAPRYGWCVMHLRRWQRRGTTEAGKYSQAPLAERIWRHIRFTDCCWEWTGAKSSAGYGEIATGNHTPRLAHVVMYELLVGPVPAGMELDHLCRKPSCVEVYHLEPVTHRENLRRGRHGGKEALGRRLL